jgi:hypothetical protein
MSEPRLVYLGTVEVDDDKTLGFDIPPNASSEKIAAAIEAANIERAEAQARESERLRKLFHLGDSAKAGLS